MGRIMRKNEKPLDLFSSCLREVQISYCNRVRYADMPKVNSSKDAESIFRSIWSHRLGYVEEFFVLLLNRSNKVIGWSKVSMGGQNGTVADPKVIFQTALKANASHIILGHNHPSGNIEPSQADISLTQKMKESGNFLDLPVLDHLILSTETYYSFIGNAGSVSPATILHRSQPSACLATAVTYLSGSIPNLSTSTTLNPAVLKIGLMQSMKQQGIV